MAQGLAKRKINALVAEHVENKRKEQGYSQNDIIGKSGVESTFEEFLKGIDGKNRLEMDSKGRITDTEVIDFP